jgi:hypothetical protein
MVESPPTLDELKLVLNRLNYEAIKIPNHVHSNHLSYTEQLNLWHRRVTEEPKYRALANSILQPIRIRFSKNEEIKKDVSISDKIKEVLFEKTHRNDIQYPNAPQMAKKLSLAVAGWASSGFKMSTTDQVSERLAICKDCVFWDSSALGGSGRCKHCGCSTQAKIRLATENCPVGKW